jgi:hypothetical protein
MIEAEDAYMRTRDNALRKKTNHSTALIASPIFPRATSYRCSSITLGPNTRNRTHAYIRSRKRYGACSLKPQCTGAHYKYLAIHMHEPARQRTRDLVNSQSGKVKKGKHCSQN